MRRPTLHLAVVFKRAVRHADEWFEEPDDLDRVERALASIDGVDDPVEAAAVLAYRVVRAQGFGEGNKRTALRSLGGCSTGTVSTAPRSFHTTTRSLQTCS